MTVEEILEKNADAVKQRELTLSNIHATVVRAYKDALSGKINPDKVPKVLKEVYLVSPPQVDLAESYFRFARDTPGAVLKDLRPPIASSFYFQSTFQYDLWMNVVQRAVDEKMTDFRAFYVKEMSTSVQHTPANHSQNAMAEAARLDNEHKTESDDEFVDLGMEDELKAIDVVVDRLGKEWDAISSGIIQKKTEIAPLEAEYKRRLSELRNKFASSSTVLPLLEPNTTFNCVRRSANALTCQKLVASSNGDVFVKVAPIEGPQDSIAMDVANSIIIAGLDPSSEWSVTILGADKCTLGPTADGVAVAKVDPHGDHVACSFSVVTGTTVWESGVSCGAWALKLHSYIDKYINASMGTGLTHNDMHVANVMYGEDGVFRAIDYGRAQFRGTVYLEKNELDSKIERMMDKTPHQVITPYDPFVSYRYLTHLSCNNVEVSSCELYYKCMWMADIITFSMQIYDILKTDIPANFLGYDQNRGVYYANFRTLEEFLEMLRPGDVVSDNLTVLKLGLVLVALMIFMTGNQGHHTLARGNFTLNHYAGEVLLNIIPSFKHPQISTTIVKTAFEQSGLAATWTSLFSTLDSPQSGGATNVLVLPNTAWVNSPAPIELFPRTLMQAAEMKAGIAPAPALGPSVSETIPATIPKSAPNRVKVVTPKKPIWRGGGKNAWATNLVLAGVVFVMSLW